MTESERRGRLLRRSVTSLYATLISLLGCLIISSDLRAQDLSAERGRVLRAIGTVRIVEAQLFPLTSNVGLVFRHEISEPLALNVRLHFKVKKAGEGARLQLRGEAGAVVWTWDGKASANGFWSAEIQGKKVIVEIFSSIPNNSLELTMDKVAIGKSEVAPVSIVGPNQLSPITSQDDAIVDLGKSVARLRFVADDGQVFVCTAFLVTADLMFTNQHCISSITEMESALVDFDFDSTEEAVAGVQLAELVDSNFGLDYSLIRLRQAVTRAPLRLSVTRPMNGRKLLIIQHPAGEPKQVSMADCEVSGALVDGRDDRPTDFGHTCDTKGGSSGSPVFDLDGRTVVGLHHLGVSPSSPDLINRAVHTDLVLANLAAATRAEIEAGQQ